MPDPAIHTSASTAEPVANGQATPPGLDAALARARRILEGDIRPDDYLPVTPEVRRLTDRLCYFLSLGLPGSDVW